MGFFLEPLYTPAYKIAGDEVAVFTTNKGVIRAKLDGEGAPIHVANFCELAESGFYDDLKFHRYEPGFVIQGGCPNTRSMTSEDVAAGKIGEDGMPGTGGPGYRIKHEYDTNPRNSHRGYTVFGQTVEGKDVVDSLRAGDVIESIRIEHAAD